MYIFSMRRLVAEALLLQGLLIGNLWGQVRIEMPSRQFKLEKKISAKVVNSTRHTLTYCVGTGPWYIGTGGSDKIELISSPFGVWKKSDN